MPLTAEDAVWTTETTLRYASGPTSYLAGTLDGVKRATALDATTLVLTFSHQPAAGL